MAFVQLKHCTGAHIGSVLWVLLAVLQPCCRAQITLGENITGIATTYGGPQDNVNPSIASGGVLDASFSKDGSCGYGRLNISEWPFWAAVSISPRSPLLQSQPAPLPGGCGMCIQVECVGNVSATGCRRQSTPLVLLVTDSCETCQPTQINMQYLAFDRRLANGQNGNIGASGTSVLDARYRRVACNPPGNITIVVSQYRASEGGYIRLTAQQVAGNGAIEAVELRQSPQRPNVDLFSSQFRPMRNLYGAAWELSGLPPAPLDVRITNALGDAVIARAAITAPLGNGSYPTNVQFSNTKQSRDASVQASDPVADSPANGFPDGVYGNSTRTLGPVALGDVDPGCKQTIPQVLQSRPDLSLFTRALQEQGLLQSLGPALSTTGITVLAPTNAAVQAASQQLQGRNLREVLLYHILLGPVLVQNFAQAPAVNGPYARLDTFNGAFAEYRPIGQGQLRFRDPPSRIATTVNGGTDLEACGGVVQVIDRVLLP